MIEVVHKSDNPEFLVVTPLRMGDTISKNTLKLINDTKSSFDWVSYSGNNNIPTNTSLGLSEYKKKFGQPKYIIKVDNDITANSNFLDSLYTTLKSSNDDVAYSYCSFSFVNGTQKISFKAIDFDSDRLLKGNYISSVSMIKTDLLDKVGRICLWWKIC